MLPLLHDENKLDPSHYKGSHQYSDHLKDEDAQDCLGSELVCMRGGPVKGMLWLHNM